MLTFQFYWPNWYKLWPHRSKAFVQHPWGDYWDNYLCIGPLQWNWWTGE